MPTLETRANFFYTLHVHLPTSETRANFCYTFICLLLKKTLLSFIRLLAYSRNKRLNLLKVYLPTPETRANIFHPLICLLQRLLHVDMLTPIHHLLGIECSGYSVAHPVGFPDDSISSCHLLVLQLFDPLLRYPTGPQVADTH